MIVVINTEFKLNEAKFFLNKLEENYSKYPDFDYYLNAFINSARSVLWIMKKEFNKIDEWLKWHDSYEVKKEEDEFLKKINDLRVQSVKIAPLTTSEQINLEIIEDTITDEVKNFFKKADGKKVDVTLSTENEESSEELINDQNGVTFKVKVKDGYLFVNEFPDGDILEVCKTYFSWLQKIVKECVKLFGESIEKNNNRARVLKFVNGDILK